MTAGEFLNILAQRIRGDAHSTAFLLRLVTQCQRAVNAGLRVVLATTTVETVPYQQIYNTEPRLPNLVSVIGVIDQNRTLDYVEDWRELSYFDRRWFRRVAPTFRAYSMMGRDLLVIHPAKQEISSVDVVYTKLTSELVRTSDSLELPEDYTPLLADLAEALALLKERRLESVTPVIERLSRELGGQSRVES